MKSTNNMKNLRIGNIIDEARKIASGQELGTKTASPVVETKKPIQVPEAEEFRKVASHLKDPEILKNTYREACVKIAKGIYPSIEDIKENPTLSNYVNIDSNADFTKIASVLRETAKQAEKVAHVKAFNAFRGLVAAEKLKRAL